MQIRRCAVLLLEPREAATFDLDHLLAGGNGLRRQRRWLALAPHMGVEIEVDPTERELLGMLSPNEWVDARTIDESDKPALRRLLKAGLVIGGGKRQQAIRARDDRVREAHWHPISAAMHAFTRWSGVDTVQNMKNTGTETAREMREVLGVPPVASTQRTPMDQWLPLPCSVRGDFDRLLARRVTCRNFDASRPLPRRLFAQLLHRVFGAQAEVRVADDAVFLKKSNPSGGGLHPIDAYLIVQNVEMVAPGLYHYQSAAHALEPLADPGVSLHEFAMTAVAQQHWFANAHVLVVLSPRFDRTNWKYRHHAKAYRVVSLEAGHLSQTMYLSATEVGLGAFISGAINEVELEHGFGLDPLIQGALAVCGFGWRGNDMDVAEFDPAGEIWSSESSS